MTTDADVDADHQHTPVEMDITVHHHGAPHHFTLPTNSSVDDLSSAIASTLHIPSENQKLLVSPKPGMLKPPFSREAGSLTQLLPGSSSSSTTTTTTTTTTKSKITLFGTPVEEIHDLNEQVEKTKRRMEARASMLAKHRSKPISSSSTSSTTSRHDPEYTFHRLLPLSHLPNPSRSLHFLARLRDDPGIISVMKKHHFSIPLLTEMDPLEHTTSSSRTLGLNRNKGEVIELRLRTDLYEGYRDYRTIRKTLCHELAHCVYSEHDADFWRLTRQIEREVDEGDYWERRKGRRLDETAEFYHPEDWERFNRTGGGEGEEGEVVDERGWTGGEYVLGGGGSSSIGTTTGSTTVESRREILAKAAEQRMKRLQEQTQRQRQEEGQ